MVDADVADRSGALLDPEAPALALVAALADRDDFPAPPGEISIVFVSDETIARIHGDYMETPEPTDVITFPGDPEMDFAGEIVVSVDHARRQASAHGQSFSRELALYLVHGWLHLAGLDDRRPEDRRAMRDAEAKIFRDLDAREAVPLFRSR